MSLTTTDFKSYPQRAPQVFESVKHCVIYTVPQLQPFRKELEADLFAHKVNWETFSYAFCWGLARALSRYHAINAYAIAGTNEPDAHLLHTLKELIEEVISDQRFATTIFDATQTLDIEAGLDLRGMRLTLHITTFPKAMPYQHLTGLTY